MELAISIISLVTALIALLTSVLPSTLNMRRNVIDFRNKYDEWTVTTITATILRSGRRRPTLPQPFPELHSMWRTAAII